MDGPNASFPSNIPISNEVDTLYGIICFICFTLGAPANAVAFYYFLQKKIELSSLLYLFVTGSDVLICLCPIPIGISYFNHRNPVLFVNTFFCNLWMLSWRILSSISIFYVALLSVTRAYLLCFPFRRVSLTLIKLLILLHMVLQVVICTNVFWSGNHHYIYSPHYVACDDVNSEPKFPKVFLDIYNWTSRISYLFPIFPIVVSCLVSVISIVSYQNKYGGQVDKEKISASVTIILFTIIYFVCNVPQALVNIINGIDNNALAPFYTWDNALYVQNFIYTLNVPINSLLNPILYFCRMNLFRQEIRRLLCSVRNKERTHLVKQDQDTIVINLRTIGSKTSQRSTNSSSI